ncbi:DRTGG domain-containing protein [Fusibacter sp. JL298sf-3]
MKVEQIVAVTEAKLLTSTEGLSWEVHSAFSSDLMSDVLAYVEEDTLLITGLVNQQVVRTAEMLDIKAILFVRGKAPTADVVELAETKHMILMSTKLPLFTTSGRLYSAGLEGIRL